MQHPIDPRKDPAQMRCTPRPDRSEVAHASLSSGSADGFSVEWVFDRYATQTERKAI